jgi:Telomere regulation protein Stn1
LQITIFISIYRWIFDFNFPCLYLLLTIVLLSGQHIYFYHNHPIQFICLAGIVVSRDEYALRTVITLDDSSGSTIEIVAEKSRSDENVSLITSGTHAAATTAVATAGATETASLGDDIPDPPLHVTATTKEALSIAALVPGAVVKVKGKISTFRSAYQLLLERFDVLRDTNAEVRFWDERSRYLADVLSTPWSLSAEEVAQLRHETDMEEERFLTQKKRAEEKQKRALQREERARIFIQKRWEKEEKIREREAALCQEESRKVPEKKTRTGTRNRHK